MSFVILFFIITFRPYFARVIQCLSISVSILLIIVVAKVTVLRIVVVHHWLLELLLLLVLHLVLDLLRQNLDKVLTDEGVRLLLWLYLLLLLLLNRNGLWLLLEHKLLGLLLDELLDQQLLLLRSKHI